VVRQQVVNGHLEFFSSSDHRLEPEILHFDGQAVPWTSMVFYRQAWYHSGVLVLPTSTIFSSIFVHLLLALIERGDSALSNNTKSKSNVRGSQLITTNSTYYLSHFIIFLMYEFQSNY
jgi:hypothetical protein